MASAVVRQNGTLAAWTAHPQEMKLFEELHELQRAVLDGRLPQFQLPVSARSRLEAGLLAVDRATRASSIPAGLSGVAADSYRKRRRIEQDLKDHSKRRYTNRERDISYVAVELDITPLLARAQEAVAPVSGLKTSLPSRKSSFDENDYYSSQVESAWSPEAVPPGEVSSALQPASLAAQHSHRLPSPHTGEAPRKRQKLAKQVGDRELIANSQATYSPQARLEHDDADDEYIPADPTSLAAELDDDDNGSDQSSSMGDDSDYQPDAVSQDVTGAFAVTASSAVPVVRNHLTQLAAPQANRVSPLTTVSQQRPAGEIQLVNGRPEFVKAPRLRNNAHTRLSSASPPANSRKLGRKAKRAKKEAERSLKLRKRRDRQMGLDMSNQIPPHHSVKNEPPSSGPMYLQRHQPPQTPSQAYLDPAIQGMQVPYAMHDTASANFRASGLSEPHMQPMRSSSTILHPAMQPPAHSSQRFVSLQHTPGPSAIEYQTPVIPARQPHEMASALPYPGQPPQYMDTRQSMAPPPAPTRTMQRVVVDQFGNRYVEAEPASDSSVGPQLEQTDHMSAFARAPSRLATAPAPTSVEQYDPTDAHFDMQPSRRAVAPSQSFEHIDGRRYRVREYMEHDPSSMHAPTSPEFQSLQPAPNPQPVAAYQRYEAPSQLRYVDNASPAYPAFQITPQAHNLRAYNVQPEYAQQAPLTYAPRQGSVAPVQYIRHELGPPIRAMSVIPNQMMPPGIDPRVPGVPIGNTVQYVDARGYEVQPTNVYSMEEYRHY